MHYDPDFSADTLLHYTKWFFSLPSEVRMSLARKAWNPKSSNHYRGYYPVTAGMTCHKEGMSIAQDLPPDDADILSENIMYEPNAWPPETLPGAVDFKKFMQSYHNSMMKVTLKISHLIAIGLGKEENYFDKLFVTKPLSTLRLMHYPPRDGRIPEVAIKDGVTLTCLEHTDTNFITLLSTFQNAGLQLQQDGKWIDVEVRPNSLVMNTGDTLTKTTGDRFKATMHRVVDHGEDRYSVPFFMEPNYFGDIGEYKKENKKDLEVNGDDEGCIIYGAWLAKRMQEKKYTDFPTRTFSKK